MAIITMVMIMIGMTVTSQIMEHQHPTKIDQAPTHGSQQKIIDRDIRRFGETFHRLQKDGDGDKEEKDGVDEAC